MELNQQLEDDDQLPFIDWITRILDSAERRESRNHQLSAEKEIDRENRNQRRTMEQLS
jgi:hypothetical protein